jgi:hypothetical protein
MLYIVYFGCFLRPEEMTGTCGEVSHWGTMGTGLTA